MGVGVSLYVRILLSFPFATAFLVERILDGLTSFFLALASELTAAAIILQVSSVFFIISRFSSNHFDCYQLIYSTNTTYHFLCQSRLKCM